MTIAPGDAGWTGDVPLPEALRAWYASRNGQGARFAVGGNPVEIPALAELWARQTGYRWHAIHGGRLHEWHDAWLAFAFEGANPFIVDTRTGDVMFDLVGGGGWSPRRVATDIATVLRLFALVAEARESWDDEVDYDADGDLKPETRERAVAAIGEALGDPPLARRFLDAWAWYADWLRIDVRKAKPADVETLAAWAEAMALETEGKVLDAATIRAGIAAGVADPHKARYLIAEHDGRAVGTLMLTTEWSDWRNGWWWWIQSVYVAPDARRLGVFRALYAHVEREARATPGVRGLRLYVENDNARAQATYAALGMIDAHYRVFEAEFPR